jgi:hypothetical protein
LWKEPPLLESDEAAELREPPEARVKPSHGIHHGAKGEREEGTDGELGGELRGEVRKHGVRPRRALAVDDDFLFRERGERLHQGSHCGVDR